MNAAPQSGQGSSTLQDPSAVSAPQIRGDDPRLIPNFDATITTFRKPRLNQDHVAAYCRDGYLLYHQPVLREPQFLRLRDKFEELLALSEAEGTRPEAMDVPHFRDHSLFEWVFSDEILDLVEPLIGPNIALYSSHFLAKPPGTGKRVPWHEDSAYWKGQMQPMHVCTVWLSIDPSLPENGCMHVIPRTLHGYSEYAPVDAEVNVFDNEVAWLRNVDTSSVSRVESAPEGVALRAQPCHLRPNEASLHDARLIHGSDGNRSNLRRCGYTMRFIPASVYWDEDQQRLPHQIYLARGQGHPENRYADPEKSYPDLYQQRTRYSNSH